MKNKWLVGYIGALVMIFSITFIFFVKHHYEKSKTSAVLAINTKETKIEPTATAAPTPISETPSVTVIPFVSGSWPNASTTGYPHGLPNDTRPPITLKKYTGSCNITGNNTIIDSEELDCTVLINAHNVVIKNSLITSGAAQAITVQNGSVIVYNTELAGKNSPESAIGDKNFTLLRVDIHGFGDGVSANGDVAMTDSYVHDFFKSETSPPPDGTHNDGVQALAGSHMAFRHNNIDLAFNENSSFMFQTDDGDISDVKFENNLVSGGAYSMYMVPSNGHKMTNIIFINNHFSRKYFTTGGQFGPLSIRDDVTFATASGNVWDDTGAPVK